MTNGFDHDVAGSLRTDITMRCFDSAGRSHTLDTVYSYCESDPYAVTITFLTPEGELPWTFGRELLISGLEAPAGRGDVHICPTVDETGRAALLIELSSPDGHLTTEAPTDEVQLFVDHSLALIPRGEEAQHLDMDGMIAGILGS